MVSFNNNNKKKHKFMKQFALLKMVQKNLQGLMLIKTLGLDIVNICYI